MKHTITHDDTTALESPPARGAGIETMNGLATAGGSKVAPRAGAGIETRTFPAVWNVTIGRPPRGGRGLKLPECVAPPPFELSPPARGVGIEPTRPGATGRPVTVAPRAGGGD